MWQESLLQGRQVCHCIFGDIGIAGTHLGELDHSGRFHRLSSNGSSADLVGCPSAIKLLAIAEFDVLVLLAFNDPGLDLERHQLALAHPDQVLACHYDYIEVFSGESVLSKVGVDLGLRVGLPVL